MSDAKAKRKPAPILPDRFYWLDEEHPAKIPAGYTALLPLPGDSKDRGIYAPETTEQQVKDWLAACKRQCGNMPFWPYWWMTNNLHHCRWYDPKFANAWWRNLGWLVKHLPEYGGTGIAFDFEDWGPKPAGIPLVWSAQDSTAKELGKAVGSLPLGFLVPGFQLDPAPHDSHTNALRAQNWLRATDTETHEAGGVLAQFGEEYACGANRVVSASRYYVGVRPKQAGKMKGLFWVYSGP